MSLAPRPGRDVRAAVALQVPAYVCGYGPRPGCAFVAQVIELSAHEATIRVEDSVPLQGRVALLLRAQDPHLDQTVAGMIVRATPSSGGMRYSLRLGGLSQEAEDEIVRYVAAQAQRAGLAADRRSPDRARPRLRAPALAPQPPTRPGGTGSGFHSAG